MTPAEKIRHTLKWLPAYLWQSLAHLAPQVRPVHLFIALADHFEPSFAPGRPGEYAPRGEQERRVERWCRDYPKAIREFRDSDGWPLRHTYFYPAEQYEKDLIHRIAVHCQDGWGELEIHLHHGISAPDTSENTRRILVECRDALVSHGCLSQWEGSAATRYAFVHGNWALANSAEGRFCGVDEEMKILAETGCYADFTLPSAPNRAQVAKINSLYECALPLHQRAPHREGRDLRRGRAPQVFPLIVQGPLLLNFARRRSGAWFPGIENSELAAANPPTMQRLALWRRAAIQVQDHPCWLFIKLHCHGMVPRDEDSMFGFAMQNFLRELIAGARETGHYTLHFVTAREMVNILLAACDGREGNPGDYRNYRLKLITPVRVP